uniref:spermatid-specific linker histone H1-like protein n=1 Tax=Jaculus jaculus TaxID=51337 RepID=UPI001E1B3075|nr:spermatid-specific linker histone H1-like protein [Jaculus jaculus]
MEVLAPRDFQPPLGEMQRDTTLLVSPSVPLTSNTAVDGNQETSTSGDTSKSESQTRPGTCPKIQRKPQMSKVILKAMADKGGHSRVSLAALKKAVATTGYNMAHNSWRFKCSIKNLVNKGVLKQVSGKGALGSFRLAKKQASKSKVKAKRLPRRQQRKKPRRRQSGQRRGGQRQSLRCRNGHERPSKGVRRGPKGHRN